MGREGAGFPSERLRGSPHLGKEVRRGQRCKMKGKLMESGGYHSNND